MVKVTTKNRKTGKSRGKAARKAKRLPKKSTPRPRTVPRQLGPKKPLQAAIIPLEPSRLPNPSSREGSGFKITIDRIDPATVIGDLIVVFPRTREVLQKHGLRLDVEHAGDIYMTLEAFAALQGLKMETLILELKEASKALLPTPAQPVPQLVAPPPA